MRLPVNRRRKPAQGQSEATNASNPRATRRADAISRSATLPLVTSLAIAAFLYPQLAARLPLPLTAGLTYEEAAAVLNERSNNVPYSIATEEPAIASRYRVGVILATWYGNPINHISETHISSFLGDFAQRWSGTGSILVESRLLVVSQMQRSKNWFFEGALRNYATEVLQPWNPTHLLFVDNDVLPCGEAGPWELTEKILEQSVTRGIFVFSSAHAVNESISGSLGGVVLIPFTLFRQIGGYSDCPSNTFRKAGRGKAALSLFERVQRLRGQQEVHIYRQNKELFTMRSKLNLTSDLVSRANNCENVQPNLELYSWVEREPVCGGHDYLQRELCVPVSILLVSVPSEATIAEIAFEGAPLPVPGHALTSTTTNQTFYIARKRMSSKIVGNGQVGGAEEGLHSMEGWTLLDMDSNESLGIVTKQGQCVGTVSNSSSELQTASCSGGLSPTQTWKRNGLLQLLHLKTGLCLDLKGSRPILAVCDALHSDWHRRTVRVPTAVNHKAPPTPGPRAYLIVPYRDRSLHLSIFVRYMEGFLKSQNVSHRILVMEQTEGSPFNRGLLLNVGFELASRQQKPKSSDYYVFHDVDYLPLPGVSYSRPQGVTSLPSLVLEGRSQFAQTLKDFAGGVLAFPDEKSYRVVNGFSNQYRGWGFEDHDMGFRLKHKRLLGQYRRVRRSLPTQGRYYLLYLEGHVSTREAHALYADNKERFESRVAAQRGMSLAEDGLTSLGPHATVQLVENHAGYSRVLVQPT